MGYAEAAPQKLMLTSMLGDTDRLCGSLSEIHARLAKIGDTLHGPELREVMREAGGNAPAAVATVRQNVDAAHSLADRIHNELTRIEARL